MSSTRRCCEAHTAIDQGIRTAPGAPMLWCGAGDPAELNRVPLNSAERGLLARALPYLEWAEERIDSETPFGWSLRCLAAEIEERLR